MQEAEDRIDRLTGRVGSLEVRVAKIETELNPIRQWVEESQGFHKEMRTFRDTLLAEQKAEVDEQTRRHRSNSTKLNIVMVLFAFVGLVLTVIGIIVSVEVAHHSEMDPAKIFHSFVSDVQLSWEHKPPQDSGLPAAYVPK